MIKEETCCPLMFQMFLWGVNEAFHPLMGPLGLQLSIFYFKSFSFSKDQYLVPRKDTKNSSNIKERITVYLEGWYVGNEISSGVWANFKFSTTLNFLFKMQSRKKKSCHVTNIKTEGGPVAYHTCLGLSHLITRLQWCSGKWDKKSSAQGYTRGH